uniref:Small Terminase n=1 Tax=Siphoviridae sp. ctM4P7 TaxID=2826256 RepID=A0A8S5MY85_9CAUD|nr:MAG TPA: Small Terminase [Siphoviridae sp. ctM4P7]
MARAPNEKALEAERLYKQGLKLIDISGKLGVPEGTIRSWKNRYKWDNDSNATLQKKKCNVAKGKGGQPGNKNALGNNGGAPEGNKNALGNKGGSAPEQNRNAEKYGFFSRYLPEETFSIIQAIDEKNPLDILWENIQLAYAAIIRAQQIMYVKDVEDKTIEKIGEKFGESSEETRWEVQQAWDKQANFLKAQARAQAELRSLIKQYDELLHKNWELATEEQKARVEVLKGKLTKNDDKPIRIEFVKASDKHG